MIDSAVTAYKYYEKKTILGVQQIISRFIPKLIKYVICQEMRHLVVMDYQFNIDSIIDGSSCFLYFHSTLTINI